MAVIVPGTKRKYTNEDANERVVNYFLNGPVGDDGYREQVLDYGGIGICTADREHIVLWFSNVQNGLRCPSTIGTRVYIESLTFSEEEQRILRRMGRESMRMLAQECAYIYFNMGHQVLYVICCSHDGCIIIHFVINAVSFCNNKKWYNNQSAVEDRNIWLNQIVQKHFKGQKCSCII